MNKMSSKFNFFAYTVTDAKLGHMRAPCRIRTVGGAVHIPSLLSTRVTPPDATERPCYPIKTVAAKRKQPDRNRYALVRYI